MTHLCYLITTNNLQVGFCPTFIFSYSRRIISLKPEKNTPGSRTIDKPEYFEQGKRVTPELGYFLNQTMTRNTTLKSDGLQLNVDGIGKNTILKYDRVY